jgi:Tfp pilus assembly protein PilX
MKTMKPYMQDESGSVTIIAALLILVMVTLLGLSAMDTTTVELTIAGNDLRSRLAFFSADSGVYGVPKIISQAVNVGAPVGFVGDPTLIAWSNPAGNPQQTFYGQIMGYVTYIAAPDIDMVLGGFNTTQVDVRRIRSKVVTGGGAEFASGHEGIGVGASGGTAIFYRLNSRGQSTRRAASNVIADYRKVVGVAGGL